VRLAFVSTILNFPLGGADTLWSRAAEAAAARGDALLVSVSPLAAAHPRIAALAAQGARLVLRETPRGLPSLATRVARRLGFAPTPDQRLLSALRTFRPDTVIFSQGGTYDLELHPPLVAWLRQESIPYRIIANWQAEEPKAGSGILPYLRDTLAAADQVNFVSTRNLDATVRHLGLPLPRARVVQNPLRWTPADTPPWPGHPVMQIAAVARLDEGKGIHLLIDALAGAALPEWKLNIYGEGPLAPALHEQAARLGLANRVQLHGHVASLRDLWAANHLLASVSLEDGVPMTIPEAMLCARPVLATRVGGAEDWLEDGRTGYLCAPRSVPALRSALEQAAARRADWRALGEAAAAAAQRRYRPEDYLTLLPS